METKHANDIEVFSSRYNETNLNVIFTKKSLWLPKKDICSLFEITEDRLDYELMKIFSDGIFSKKENRERFQIGGKRKITEFFRLGVIISLGYRIKATSGTKYIIHTNRVIKTRLSKNAQKIESIIEENVDNETENNSLQEKNMDILNKALELVHSLRRQEISKRMHA
ncbi:hypothetical protein LR004_01820 [Candidatus Gracilibacteria bacterium]|nr:hypothetical protein [Candidatus Gracilibacteria bacterium]